MRCSIAVRFSSPKCDQHNLFFASIARTRANFLENVLFVWTRIVPSQVLLPLRGFGCLFASAVTTTEAHLMPVASASCCILTDSQNISLTRFFIVCLMSESLRLTLLLLMMCVFIQISVPCMRSSNA